MQIYNIGTIDLDHRLTHEAIEALLKNPITRDYASECAHPGDYALVYNDDGGDLLDEIREIVNVLAPLGYVLDGEVEYYGDYDGKIYIENNEVIDVDVTDIGLHEASDETLIQILESRGYTVTKGRK